MNRSIYRVILGYVAVVGSALHTGNIISPRLVMWGFGEKKEEPKQPQDPNEMTEEEAQQILDALQQQEKELQEDLQKKKQQGVKLKILKDW